MLALSHECEISECKSGQFFDGSSLISGMATTAVLFERQHEPAPDVAGTIRRIGQAISAYRRRVRIDMGARSWLSWPSHSTRT